MISNEGIPSRAAAVTPSDTAGTYAAALYVGGAGNLKVTTVEGDAVTFSSVPAGTIIPLQVKLVWSTGTTATNIVRMF